MVRLKLENRIRLYFVVMASLLGFSCFHHFLLIRFSACLKSHANMTFYSGVKYNLFYKGFDQTFFLKTFINYILDKDQCVKATEPLWLDTLLLTNESPGVLGTHLTEPGRMKGLVDLGGTYWLWTRVPWIGNPVPWSLDQSSISCNWSNSPLCFV